MVWLVELGEGSVGFASFGPSRDEDAAPDTGELYAIYLAPEAWGKGAGRALLVRAEHELLATGFRAATLWVLEGNDRARRFYEAGGWGPDGRDQELTIGGVSLLELRYGKPLG